MTLYPLLMAPYFRHGAQTPWGGDALRDMLMKPAPEQTGESLEVSTLEGMESVVRNGAHAGQSFRRVFEQWGSALTGTDDAVFPLMLKLLDARTFLSVQVHPDDAYAAREGKLGKTEAWMILSCDSGAKIAYGMDANAAPAKLFASGDAAAIEAAVRWKTVRPGDVYYMPAGMLHALGAGILAYEIQQSSDVTYRVWDWGRLGKDGQPRELHIQQAIDVVRPELQLEKVYGTTSLCRGGSRTYYVCNRYFEMCRLNISGRMPLSDGRMHFVTPLAPCRLTWGDEALELNPFDTVVIPAALEDVTIECDGGDGKALMSSTSNREALRAELGYRAENVAGLCEE